MAESNVKIRIGLDGQREVVDQLRDIGSAAAKLGEILSSASGIGKLFAAGGVFGLGAISISSIARGFGNAVTEGIKFNATIEQQRVAFSTLLGSMDAASARLKQLTQFAASTPFEFPEVVQTSRILQSLGGDVLATGRGLQLVGDAAAAVGAPFRDVAFWIGRLYSGLQAGRPVGEATARLVELGLITGQRAAELNKLAESGAAVGSAFDVTAKTFGRFTGAMEAQSRTLNGLLSTMRDSVRSFLGDITEPLANASRTILEQTLSFFGQISPEDAIGARLRQTLAARRATQMTAAPTPQSQAAEQDARIQASQDRLRQKLGIDFQNKLDEERIRIGQKNLQADLDAKRISIEEYEQWRRAQIEETYQLEIATQRIVNIDLANQNKANDGRQAWIVKEVIARNEITDELAKQNRLRAQEELANEISARRERENLKTQEENRRAEEKALKEKQASIERELQIRQQILAIDLQMIRSNFRTTQAEKFALTRQRIAGAERTGVITPEEARMEYSMQGADPQSFTQQFQATLVELQNQFGTVAQQMARTFADVFNAATASISNGIQGLIMGTTTWGRALLSIGQGIVQSLVKSFADMVAGWIMSHVIMRGVSMAWSGFQSALRAKDVAESNATEAAKMPALAGNAMLASVGSFGVAAVVGAAAMAGILAAIGAFQAGGYTGDGPPGEVAGIVHRGEYVVPADAVDRIGIGTLEAISSGAALPAVAPSGGPSPITMNMAVFDDPRRLADWARSQEGRAVIVDIFRQHAHELTAA